MGVLEMMRSPETPSHIPGRWTQKINHYPVGQFNIWKWCVPRKPRHKFMDMGRSIMAWWLPKWSGNHGSLKSIGFVMGFAGTASHFGQQFQCQKVIDFSIIFWGWLNLCPWHLAPPKAPGWWSQCCSEVLRSWLRLGTVAFHFGGHIVCQKG